MSQNPTATRRYDPDRRLNIARATIRLVSRMGVDNLTFRAVAREADVPLGSLTYHYANKEELLLTALTMAREQGATFVGGLLARFQPEQDFARALAHLIEALTVEQREQLILDFEWIFATRRRPTLADEHRQWNDSLIDLFARYTDRQRAQWASTLFQGCLMEAVTLDKRYLAADIEPAVRRLVSD